MRFTSWAARQFGFVPLAAYRKLERERDDAAALAAARYDDVRMLYQISSRQAERVQADLDAMRATAVVIEESARDVSIEDKAREIRKLIHDLRGHL